MHKLTRTLLTLFLLVPGAYRSQDAAVSGHAFIDANGNGVRDAGERGLANVAVSNQDAVIATDATGAYRLPRGSSGIVFVSVPDGYRSVGPFWRRAGDAAPTVDFAVSPVARSETFTFIHASDTHLAPASLARTERFRALSDALNPAFVLITGDLVRDALRVGEAEATGYYDLVDREAALFKNTVWTVPGNHENFGIERDKSKVSATHPLYGRKMYYQHRGPDYYSFNFGGVHFVGLNTVDTDDQWYYGHVDSLQLAWLERDLALVPAAMPVVTFNHIPFFSSFEALGGFTDAPPAPTLITVNGKTMFRHTVSNARDVLAVLRTRRHVLALGGHIHASEHIEFETDGLKTRFNQAAAIVGPAAGATFQFTSGFTVYTVRDGIIDEGRFVPLGTVAQAAPPAPQTAEELVRALREFPAGIPGGGRPELPPIEQRRVEIYDKLWSLGAAAVPALCRGVSDPDVQIRRNAVLFLNVAGGDWYDIKRPRLAIAACETAVIKALEDADGRVRELAGQSPALGPASVAAVPALIRLLGSSSEGDRNTACIGLARIGPAAKAALPALNKALSDPSADVRSFAKRAIDRIG